MLAATQLLVRQLWHPQRVRHVASAAAASVLPNDTPSPLLRPRKARRRITEESPILAPLVAEHPVHRTLASAPPGVSLQRHREASVRFAGLVAPAAARSSSAASASAVPPAAAASAPAAAGRRRARVRLDETSTETSETSAASSDDSAARGHHAAASSGSDAEPATADASSSLALRRKSWLAGDSSAEGRGGGGGVNAGALPHLTEDAPPAHARLFAVVGLGSTQYKVTAGDVVTVEHIPLAAVGTVLTLGADAVLAVGSCDKTVLGRPGVPGAEVRLGVEEQALDRKLIVFKKKRRKRYQRTRGHRRMVTRLRVLSVLVRAPGAAGGAEAASGVTGQDGAAASRAGFDAL